MQIWHKQKFYFQFNVVENPFYGQDFNLDVDKWCYKINIYNSLVASAKEIGNSYFSCFKMVVTSKWQTILFFRTAFSVFTFLFYLKKTFLRSMLVFGFGIGFEFVLLQLN